MPPTEHTPLLGEMGVQVTDPMRVEEGPAATEMKDVLASDDLDALPEVHNTVKPWHLLGCVVVGVILYLVPIMQADDQGPAHRCFVMMMVVGLMWTTEALPIWVTALLVPMLTVPMKVLLVNDGKDGETETKSTKDAADESTEEFFDPVILLFLGGFTIAAATTKYRLSHRLATFVLNKAGTRPDRLVLFAMLLGCFLSMWVSNVASSVICVSFVTPIIGQRGMDRQYAKLMLLGVAFSNNVGGMLTPIASPQNVIALKHLRDEGHHTVPFSTWMFMAVPYGIVVIVVTYFFLMWWYRPSIRTIDTSKLAHTFPPLNRVQWIVCGVTGLTILLWCIFPVIKGAFGDQGIIALLPVVVFFGSGILTKADFDSLQWNVLMLMGGGLSLGRAIKSSQLLSILATNIKSMVSGQGMWVVQQAFSAFVGIFGSFISSTVACIIVSPITSKIGYELGHPAMLAVTTALMCSGAQILPISSFPNANSFGVNDEDGKQILSIDDYLKAGLICTLLNIVLMASAGYGLMLMVGW